MSVDNHFRSHIHGFLKDGQICFIFLYSINVCQLGMSCQNGNRPFKFCNLYGETPIIGLVCSVHPQMHGCVEI